MPKEKILSATKVKTVNLEEELLEKIAAYQKEKKINSFSNAVRNLLSDHFDTLEAAKNNQSM